ncbi:MAG: hypothetical protein HY976_02955 [Candidatus Kerfeldbacteria bacterium]|nr:hypothetical protein [Candidatus Kerfeldbacteria bacterium]
MLNPKPIWESVLFEGLRNLVIDGGFDWLLPQLKYVPDGETDVVRYRDASGKEIPLIDSQTGKEVRLVYAEFVQLFRTKPKETRSVLVALNQGVYSAVLKLPFARILPFEKFPGLEKGTKFFLEQLGETLEQMPDSLRAYTAHEDHIVYPEGFTVRDPKQVAEELLAFAKSKFDSAGDALVDALKGRVPVLEQAIEPIAKFLPSFKGGASESVKYRHLAAIRREQPDLLGEWIKFIAQMPKDVEDDLRRIDGVLADNVEIVAEIINLPDEQRYSFIERLAPDTAHEQFAGAVAGGVGAANEILDEASKLLQDRKNKRAAKKAARLGSPNPTGPSVTAPTEKVVEVMEIVRIRPVSPNDSAV